MLQGHLENIKEDGLITGWCWDPDQPAKRVELTVLVDNEPIGALVADDFRSDLGTAGIGDGAHAFSFLLPWSAVARKSVTSVHVADPSNNRPIGGSLTFRRSALLPVEQRIAELEHSMRLLRARLEEVNHRASRATALVQTTLATIGTFFTRLSELPLETLSRTEPADIRALLASTRADCAPFAFDVPAAPSMTICVCGAFSLRAFYGCLRAIKACNLDAAAEIVVIDDSHGGDAALLPLLVENIRYWSAEAAQSPLLARNRVAALHPRDFLLFLSPAVHLRPGWLEGIRSALAAHPRCAVLGSPILRQDGTIQSSALTGDAVGRLRDSACGELPEAPWHNRLAAVAAVPDHAFLVRQDVFRALDGFDPGYVDPAAAATDFCLRCWAAGHSVLYQPAAALSWPDESLGSAGSAGDPDLATLLAQRWQGVSRAAWPAPVGQALIIDAEDAALADRALHSARALQQLGYEVTFGCVTALDAELPVYEALRASGVQVLKAPHHPSVLAAVERAAPPFDIIQLSAVAAASLLPETVRSASPGSRVILALDDVTAKQHTGTEGPGPTRLGTALADATAVIARNDQVRQALPRGARAPALGVLSPGATPARKGLWLTLDGPDEAVSDAGRWLSTLLPALAKAAPAEPIHTRRQPGLTLPSWVTQHPAATVELLRGMRLALAPFRRPALMPATFAACAEAGLPLIATNAALGGATPPAAVVTVAANAQAIGRLLRQLEDEAAWAMVAAPLQPAMDGGHRAGAYRSLARSVKLRTA